MAAERTESKDRISGRYASMVTSGNRGAILEIPKENKSAVTGCADKRYRMFKGVMACS